MKLIKNWRPFPSCVGSAKSDKGIVLALALAALVGWGMAFYAAYECAQWEKAWNDLHRNCTIIYPNI